MKCTIPKQLNFEHFAYSHNTLKKLSPTSQPHLLYLLSDQCVKTSMKRASKVFISFHNQSLEDEIEEGDESPLIAGILHRDRIDRQTISGCSSAIYLNTGLNQIICNGTTVPTSTFLTFNRQDTITMVIDLDEGQLEWLLNSLSVCKVKIDSLLLE
jgi:hypothetical protein